MTGDEFAHRRRPVFLEVAPGRIYGRLAGLAVAAGGELDSREDIAALVRRRLVEAVRR